MPSWVTEAACLPLAFAQVREDALLDLEVVAGLGGAARVLMVASGGCTAAALAASGRVAKLLLVDPNPAQIALTRLKLRMLQAAEPRHRGALLGHESMSLRERRDELAAGLSELGLQADALGPVHVVAKLGPDYSGRYERVFAELARELTPFAKELESLLRLRGTAAQAAGVAPRTLLGEALDAAFDRVLALPNLVRLFGERATGNSAGSFSRHFMGRTRLALATFPAADNPYLWQMLLNRYPPEVASPWLYGPKLGALPEIDWTVGQMSPTLDSVRESFDFVHLSNILDWLPPEDARETLTRAASILRPGGVVLVRQLNSNLEIPALCPEFDWDFDGAKDLHARDRSFFYRALHLGRRR